MVIWIIYIVVLIIATVLAVVLRPKPNIPNLLPGQVTNVPVAEQGKPIPVIFGTRYIRQPNVVWWGKVRPQPITRLMGGGKSG
jgi:hypothetical protein